MIRFFYKKNCLGLGIFVLAFLFLGQLTAKPIKEYVDLDREDLALFIGEKIYNQPGDGCWSCHGSTGVKTDTKNLDKDIKNKNIADLRNPASWTSFKIIQKYTGNSTMLSQRDISLSLVRLGAEDWNNELAPLIREYTGSNIIFFDEQMIGIHSKLLKKNARSISRKLKREKVKFKARDIIDIMATSVFFYIEESFIKK